MEVAVSDNNMDLMGSEKRSEGHVSPSHLAKKEDASNHVAAADDSKAAPSGESSEKVPPAVEEATKPAAPVHAPPVAAVAAATENHVKPESGASAPVATEVKEAPLPTLEEKKEEKESKGEAEEKVIEKAKPDTGSEAEGKAQTANGNAAGFAGETVNESSTAPAVVAEEETATTPTPTPGETDGGSHFKYPMVHAVESTCSKIIDLLMKRNDSFWFWDPVDPVKLNIPTYFDIVKRPMDFGTIRKKLSTRAYQFANEFVDDVSLVFSNCRLFNHPDTPVVAACNKLDMFFKEKLAGLSRAIQNQINPTKGGRPSPAPHKRAYSEDEPSTPDRPKRAKHTPPPKDLTVDESDPWKFSKSLSGELRHCDKILKDLTGNRKYQDIAIPFLHPVNTSIYTDYPLIVKEPMDFETVREKLESGKYQSMAEFATDVRLIFSNCYLYNPPGQPIRQNALILQTAFEHQYATVQSSVTKATELQVASTPKPPPEVHVSTAISTPSSKPLVSSTHKSSSNKKHHSSKKDKSHAKERGENDVVKKLQEQIERLSNQLNTIKHQATPSAKSSKKKRPVSPSSSPSKKSRSKHSSGSKRKLDGGKSKKLSSKEKKKFKKEKKKEALKTSHSSKAKKPSSSNMDVPMTLKEKESLSGNISKLGEEKVNKVVEILQSRHPELKSSEDRTIEIDIDSLDTRTLREMEKFVNESLGIAKKKKVERKKVVDIDESSSSSSSSSSESEADSSSSDDSGSSSSDDSD